MKVIEEHNIIIEKHPFFQSLKEKLLKDVENVDYPLSYQTEIKAKHSSSSISTPTTELINEWISSIIHINHPWIRERKFELVFPEVWFAEYSKHEFTVSHDHTPNVRHNWSYVYFIQCPKGSSPLVFTSSGKKIKAEEGKVVIFPSMMKHHVPPNKCENRLVVAGNVMSLRDL